MRCSRKKGPSPWRTPMAVSAFAPAKINLSLHVTGRRDDGYHQLDSLVVFVDAGDELFAEPAAELGEHHPRNRGSGGQAVTPPRAFHRVTLPGQPVGSPLHRLPADPEPSGQNGSRGPGFTEGGEQVHVNPS